MATLIDSSLWVDYFRLKAPPAIKQQIVPYIDDADAWLCEPVRFEILRAALKSERHRVEETFATFPVLPTPGDIWRRAAHLGQGCIDSGVQPRSMDLLIAVVCLEAGLTLVTFDSHFAAIAEVCEMNLHLLSRST
jgi:predicted nucleic acid-binding protein